MIQETHAFLVSTVPKDLLALIIGREYVVIRPDTFKYLLGYDVDIRLLLASSSVPDLDYTLVSVIYGFEYGELIWAWTK